MSTLKCLKIIAVIILLTLLPISAGMTIPFFSLAMTSCEVPLLGLYWRLFLFNPTNFASSEEETLTLVAAGDVMLARRVETYISEHGPFYPFSNTAFFTRSADIAFCNLENAFSLQGKPIPGKGIWFRTDPGAAMGLTYAGFDVVSIANNHTLDFDTSAFIDTLRTLDEEEIRYVGGGENLEEARRPVILERKNIKVGFLAYSELAHIFWDWGYPRAFAAENKKAGVAPMDLNIMLEDIKKLEGQVDFIVISLHWGEEYIERPSLKEREIAHKLIDGGAHVILGHHPHVVRGLEVYKGGLIAYSLGNFVFDQKNPITQQSMLLQLELRDDGIAKVLIYPLIIKDSRPSIPDRETRKEILSKLKRLSAELSTSMEFQGKKGVIYLDAQQQAPSLNPPFHELASY